jgi:phosphoenolpyruvate synthase/pyruvate phosphate dikinase
MQNLDQIRARNAYGFAKTSSARGADGGNVIDKVPPLLLNHGLLATAAYSFTEKSGWQDIFDAIAKHLADTDICIIPASVQDRSKLMEHLTAKTTTSETLKLATAEAMAWLAFARRFVKQAERERKAATPQAR